MRYAEHNQKYCHCQASVCFAECWMGYRTLVKEPEGGCDVRKGAGYYWHWTVLSGWLV
jgi:hypothetical protein